MTPGDEERIDPPGDSAIAAGESAPSSGLVMDQTTPPVEAPDNRDSIPPMLAESSVDTSDDQRNAGADEPPKSNEFVEAAKADDEVVDEVVADTTAKEPKSLADDDDEPTADAEAEEKPKAKPKRRRKKAEEDSGLPKVAEELMQWFVLKVQSNREDSISDAIKRRLKIAGLDPHVGEVIVPTEKVLEIKDGKKRVVKRKFYPGYIMLRMELTDDVWFIIRDTPGVGHFLGAAEKPLPMTATDVERMLGRTLAAETESTVKEAAPRPAIEFVKGDRVVIKEGPFENFEGDVEEVNEDKGTVRVMIQIFGRPTPVDVKYWEVGKVRM
jgi:transcription termination/antitermination protein NusG